MKRSLLFYLNERLRRCAGAAAPLIVAVLLSGCPQSGPSSSPTPEVSATATVTPTPASPTPTEKPWISRQLLEGTVSVETPTEVTEEKLGEFTTAYATADDRYNIIVTVAEDFKDSDPDEALEELKSVVLEEAGGKETASALVETAGQPAIRFAFDVDHEEGAYHVEVLSVMVEGRALVQLVANEAEHQRFFDSFQVKSSPEPSATPEAEATP